MKNIYLTAIAILFTTLALAQNTKSNFQWRFGNGVALSFASGAPVSLTGSAINTAEGNAAISDTAGNLLFYTDGVSVWNANNNVMPNGTGLKGSPISDQSALIIPSPGNSNQYYLFTVPDWETTGSGNGLFYSIVDMTLNSGTGDISTVKNVLVDPDAREQQTAIISANGQGVWILIHAYNSQNFNAYLLTASGLDTVPVVSPVGMVYGGVNRYGQLHFSRDCKSKLISVLGSDYSVNETVQLFDFDNVTGIVSNPVTLATYSAIPQAYGAAFSPDNSKLYVTAYNQSYVYQFDLNNANIASTITNIATSNLGTASTICQAPDGKIYVDMNGHAALSIIESPDTLGTACNFHYDAFGLSSGSCKLALPNFLTQLPVLSITIDVLNASCNLDNGSVIADLDLADGPYTYLWSSGGNTDTLYNLPVGTYSITVTDTIGCSGTASASIISSGGTEVTPTIIISGNNALCSGATATFNAVITNGGSIPAYQWEINGTHIGTDSSLFSYSGFNIGDTVTCVLTSNSGCANPDSAISNSIILTQNPNVIITSNKMIVCPGDSVTICAPNFYSTYSWSTGETTPCITTPYVGNYYVTVTTNGGCSATSNVIAITNYPLTPVTISESGDTLTCYNAQKYQWYFGNQPLSGDTVFTLIAAQSGIYSVQITDSNGCYTNSSPIHVIVGGISSIVMGDNVKVYPNPSSSGNWYLELSNDWIGAWCGIYDVNGQLLYRSLIKDQTSKISLICTAGIYLMRLESGVKVTCLKLIMF